LLPVVLILGLSVAGFFLARASGETNAKRDATHRADLAATQVRDHVADAGTLMDGMRRFLVGHAGSSVATEDFADIGARWLSPAGLPAAGWVEAVPSTQRSAYERRLGHRIVEPLRSGGIASAGLSGRYLPATLVTGVPPLTTPGLDLERMPGVKAAVARPQTAYAATATPLEHLPDGTSGLFVVQAAPRLNRGVVEPGFAVLFVPASWLLAAGSAALGPAPATSPKLQITVGGGSAGDLKGVATVLTTFEAAGQPFEIRVSRSAVAGADALLPWLVGGAGLSLALLVGALGLIGARRTRAKADLDRLFTLSPDMIVVAGFDGYFKRVNPAFEEQLGYTEQEALSRPYIEFVHPDDRERTTSRSGTLQEGATTVAFENRYVCKDGSARWIEWTSTPVAAERLIFSVARDVTERRRAEADLRDAEERTRGLADEQAALRRVATLVARRAPAEELFAAVAKEVGQLLPVTSAAMGQCEPDGTLTTVAAWSAGAVAAFPVGRRWIPEGRNVTTLVVETGRPARMDDFAQATGPVGVQAREAGYRSAVGTPITVDGQLWGVMTAASTAAEPLPADTELRLASFTELVATAIANAESRAALARLADEQAALRRVATLVAEGVQPAEVFAAVGQEVIGLLDAQNAAIARLEDDGTYTIVANSGITTVALPVGSRHAPAPGWVVNAVVETRRSARRDNYDTASGDIPAAISDLGVNSSVAAPIVVEGALWGVVIVGTSLDRFPDGTEQRLEEFTELAATAIANASSRSELAASRARIVAASDETRRRIERDLHDGTQQRLVSLSFKLRLAESSIPAELDEARQTMDGVVGELNRVIEELREIARGIHPAILSEGGLGPAMRTLARRSAIPVELGNLIEHRLPEPIEVAAYYVVSEALTNAAKHANASHVQVETAVRDGSLRLSIDDDGHGGANPAQGSGLVGLRDRVEAVGGSIEIDSPRGEGTHIVVQLPLETDFATNESKDASRPETPASRSS
jgi:PAS domain S-box-containing protein